MIKFRMMIAVGAAGTASLAWAAAPTTRPAKSNPAAVVTATTKPTRSAALQDFRQRMARIREAANGVDFSGTSHEPPTPKEWAEISEFSQKNFPNRWSMYVKIRDQRGENSDVAKAIRLKLALRYRGLMKAQTDMPDVYDSAMEQGQLEDATWGTLLKLKKDPENEKLRAELHDKVGALVNAVLKNRADHLEALQNIVADEQSRLDTDRAHLDQLIDRQVNRLMNEHPFGRGDGFGGRTRRDGSPRNRDTNRPGADSSSDQSSDAPAPADKPNAGQ